MSPCVLYMVITPKDIWKVGKQAIGVQMGM